MVTWYGPAKYTAAKCRVKARTQRGDENCGPTGAGAGAVGRVGLDEVPWSAAATEVVAAAAWTGVGRSNVDVHVLQDQHTHCEH